MNRTLKTVAPIYIAAVLMIVFTQIGWLHLPEPFGSLTTEIGVALLAVASIHILDHRTLIREVAERIAAQTRDAFTTILSNATKDMTYNVKGTIDNATATIVTNVTADTHNALDEASQVLQRQVASLRVMEESNLIAIYPGRDSAATAIRQAMATSHEIWLMGISLNEFCRHEYGEFRRAWDELVKGIREQNKKARLLLIDPYSHGAVLRSYSETVDTDGVEDRLEDDIKGAAKLLHRLRSELGDRASDLDVRMYRLAPTAFMCRTDTFAFTQQYYFWKKRLPGSPIPLFQYRKRGKGHDGLCIYSELEQHFEFIWNHASIPLDKPPRSTAPGGFTNHFWPKPTRGLGWGAHASGMETVFVDSDRPAHRMQEEILTTRKLCIQGITLKAFFNDSVLAKALDRRMAAIRQGVDPLEVRIMVLDPECEQAVARAYREFQLNSPHLASSIKEFKDKYYRQSRLSVDLHTTIDRLKGMDGIVCKTYDTAPHLFVLIGDSAAFAEQYTYGKIIRPSPSEDEVILGSDMPLIEYASSIDAVYTRALRQLRSEENDYTEQLRPQPYPLLVNHFDYAWAQAHNI